MVEDLKPGGFDERALFHLMNLAREDGAFVLFTARTAPAAFELELRDLRSRLRAVPVVTLSPPDDQLFRALIVKFCADRQLSVDESRGQLSRQPDRALLCGSAAGGRTAGYGGLAAGPAGNPGAGRGIAAQRLNLPQAALTAARRGTSMSLKRHRNITWFAVHLPDNGDTAASRWIEFLWNPRKPL